MYTGYFAKLKTYIDAGLVPVSICGKAPDWYEGFQYKYLAPKWSFFNEWKNGTEHKGDNEYYIQHFNDEVLKGRSYIQTMEDLQRITGIDDLNKVILICYEKPSDFCHRHLVAKWFIENGINCEEFPV
jgi:hypothetical protein